MTYMVVHEQLKNGGWRTTVPDIPHCGAVSGVKFETRRRSAERNVRKRVEALIRAEKVLPEDATKIVRMKRTVKRCYVHFVRVKPIGETGMGGAHR